MARRIPSGKTRGFTFVELMVVITIVVILIISPVFTANFHVLQTGGNSVSFLIANLVGESSSFGISALMAAGLALFAMTLIINFSASAVVARSRSGAESDG